MEKLEQKLAEAEDILRQKREDKKGEVSNIIDAFQHHIIHCTIIFSAALENQVLDDEAEAKQLEEVSSSKLSTDPEIVK